MSPPGAASPIGVKFRKKKLNSPGSKVTWPELQCISIRKTRTIDLRWVNISRVISDVSRPKFTIFRVSRRRNRSYNAVYQLSISVFVPEIFAVKVESCRKTY